MSFFNNIWKSMKGYIPFGFNAFGGYTQYKQTQLIEEGYASNTDLYAIIKKISETGANIPIILQTMNEDGNWVKLEEGGSDPAEQRLIELLKMPNEYQNFSTYLEQAIAYLLMTGESFTKGEEIAGTDLFSSFYVVPSNYVEVVDDENTFPVTPEGYKINNPYSNTTQIDVSKEDMMFIKYQNPTDWGNETARGMSPLQAGYLTLVASNEVNMANAEILRNKGAAGILSNESGRAMKEEERGMFQKLLDGMLGGGEKAGKIISSPIKMSYLQLGMSSTDLQIIESGVFKLRQLCNLYAVDSSIFNDPANKTFNNRLEATKALYNEAVIPAVNRIIKGLNNWLLRPFSEDTGNMYRLVVDTSSIEALQGDQKAEAEKNKIVADSVSSIASMVTKGDLDSEAAQNILVFSYGMTEEQASELIPSNPNMTGDE